MFITNLFHLPNKLQKLANRKAKEIINDTKSSDNNIYQLQQNLSQHNINHSDIALIPDEMLYKNFDYLVYGWGYRGGEKIPVGIRRSDIPKHTHILGAQGSGKTSLMVVLAYESIRKGFTTVIVDPHGGLVKEVYERTPPDIPTYIVGPGYDGIQLFPYVNIKVALERLENPELPPETEERVLAIRAINEGFRTHFGSSASTKGVWGTNVAKISEYAMRTLSVAPPSERKLSNLERIVIDQDYRQWILEEAKKYPFLMGEIRKIESFWYDEYENLILQKQDSATTVMGYLNKISVLYPTPLRERILSGDMTLYDFFLSDKPKLLLMHLPEGDEWVKLVGALLFATINMAAFSRTAYWRNRGYRPVHVIIDEVATFSTALPLLQDSLTKVRKFGVGLTLAHQDFAQLGEHAQSFGKTVSSQAAQTILLSVAGEAADYLSGRIDESEKDLIGPQPPGHFVFINREKKKFRGISFYFEWLLPRQRTMPAQHYIKEKVAIEDLRIGRFIPEILESFGYDPSSMRKIPTPFKKTPYFVADDEMYKKLLSLKNLFGKTYLPVALALAPIELNGKKIGYPWLNGWAVGSLEISKNRVPVLYDYITIKTPEKTIRKYIFKWGAYIEKVEDIPEVSTYLDYISDLINTDNKKQRILLHIYDFKGDKFAEVDTVPIASIKWIESFFIYMSSAEHIDEDELEDIADKLAWLGDAHFIQVQPFTIEYTKPSELQNM